MTTKSPRSTASTRRGRITRGRSGKSNGCTRSKRGKNECRDRSRNRECGEDAERRASGAERAGGQEGQSENPPRAVRRGCGADRCCRWLAVLLPQPGEHGRCAGGRPHHADRSEGLWASGASLREGQRGGQGRAIAGKIDARDYQAAVDQAKAALAVAESEARSAGVDVPRTRENVASGTSSAEAQLLAAQADLASAQ